MLKVAFNTYPVAFDCPGGGEIQLRQNAAGLTKLGVRVDMFDLWNPALDDADLVHYFSVQGGSMNFCSYVKLTKHMPLVISPVLWLTQENRDQFPLGEIHDLLHLCDRFLPNSETEARQLCQEFNLDPERACVVHNGVDEAFGRPISEEIFREHFDVRDMFLLNVANIEPRKNQLRLAEVASDLGIDLVVLGHVRDEDYHRACRDMAGSHWRWLGSVAHDSDLLKSAYRACELFVLPSLLETPGLAALEAAAAGAKVVVTSEGAARDYFGDFVSYVDPLSISEIRSGVEMGLGKTAGNELADHVLGNFTWRHVASQLHRAYLGVVSEREFA
jgi:glycosyltransferase involved in cell wall biosynthesis